MKNKIKIPMTYEITLSDGGKAYIETPVPFNEMTKKDKVKFKKGAFRFIDAIYEKSKVEAISQVDYHKAEIKRLENAFNLKGE